MDGAAEKPSALTKAERKELRKEKRQNAMAQILERVLRKDLKAVRLRQFMFLTDDELSAGMFTAQQKRMIRAWEEPKKTAPAGLMASHEMVMALLRREEPQKQLTVNVQNMAVIRLPEKAEDDSEPVVIDVEPAR